MMSDAAFAAGLIEAEPVLRRCAVRWLGWYSPDAEDLVQQTLLIAWEKRARYTPQPGKPMTKWLTTICGNCMRSAWRKQAKHGHVPIEDAPEPTLDGEQEAAILAAELRALADRKPGGAALLDRIAAGDDYETIAACCGIAFGTVQSRTSRVRAALMQEMA